jgi:hypothetical protein
MPMKGVWGGGGGTWRELGVRNYEDWHYRSKHRTLLLNVTSELKFNPKGFCFHVVRPILISNGSIVKACRPFIFKIANTGYALPP